jgi:V8-like Glu-specific endopeptidase
VKEITGQNDLAELIDILLVAYKLTEPVAVTLTELVTGDTADDASSLTEKIIGENTLRHVNFLAQGIDAARSVALVRTDKWVGTGFLVADHLLMSNHHVIPSREIAESAKFWFNYALDNHGRTEQVAEFKAKEHGFFHSDASLDFSLVELEGHPGRDWGSLPWTFREVSLAQRVNIIQHPAGMPKQISIQNNFVKYVDTRIVQYLTSTLGGSSGSPVLNDEWQVVAVHHAGGMLRDPASGNFFSRNEGMRVSAIGATLTSEIKDILTVV